MKAKNAPDPVSPSLFERIAAATRRVQRGAVIRSEPNRLRACPPDRFLSPVLCVRRSQE